MMTLRLLTLFGVLRLAKCRGALPDLRQCEPIRIEMCRGIGYNQTSMPNLVGHELQSDVEYTLQTFAPLIKYVCSSQLKLFLCAAYVPMCTPKVPVHAIGPCRSLCESVRLRCHPVLQGFGFPWPPALDCERFPIENNHETMCMEGPGEELSPMKDSELYGAVGPLNGYNGKIANQDASLECPGWAKANLYMKLHRSGRCAPLCDADILFTQKEKYLTELWLSTWAYAALGAGIIATLCLLVNDGIRCNAQLSRIMIPLVWCHDMVTVGWAIRFIAGRTATACGFDPQLPNVSLRTIDGFSNAPCASVFLLRYYFGMSSCAWWAILCLCWHRKVRQCSPDAKGHISMPVNYTNDVSALRKNKSAGLTYNNLLCVVAWGVPAFQTAAVIVARLVDADELIGACFVGNQYDKGLQLLVAIPIFCYWIFGSMNLVSGYLINLRNKDIVRTSNSLALQQHLKRNNDSSGIGTFLFIYGISCGILLFAIIYEFANIDVWLSAEPSHLVDSGTPLWSFLTRAFMELMLGIICFAWILGPNISQLYKRQTTPQAKKQPTTSTISLERQLASNVRTSLPAGSTIVSYKSARPHFNKHSTTHSPQQISNYSIGLSSNDSIDPAANSSLLHLYVNSHQKYSHRHKPLNQKLHRYRNETLL